jgi:hypothetical protein
VKSNPAGMGNLAIGIGNTAKISSLLMYSIFTLFYILCFSIKIFLGPNIFFYK